MVDEAGPGADESVAAAEQGEISLARLAPVHDRTEEGRVEPADPREIGGICLVTLGVVAVDEPQHAGVGDDHFVTALVEQSANPVRVCADFDDESGRSHAREASG